MLAKPSDDLARILRRRAEAYPDKTFIIHEDRRVSYAEAAAAVARMAALMAELGAQKGDLVGVFMGKTPEAVIAFLAAASLGAVFFPLDFHQPPKALRAQLLALSPRVVVSAGEYPSLLASMFPEGAPFRLIDADGGEKAGAVPFSPNFSNSLDLPEPGTDENGLVYLNFTSGTTGESKGAATTQGNLYWNTKAACESLGITPDDAHLCMMPIFVHPHELFARPLYLGGTMVLTDNIAPKHVASLITRHRVACFMGVASIYETLVRLTDVSAYDFSSLRIPESGGMHVTANLVKQFADRFGARLLPVWGSTETTGIAMATPPGEPYRPGAAGKPIPYYQVRVETPEGEEAAPGEVGELVVSGPGVCPGYYGREPRPGDALRDNRFATGDMFKRDADGFYHFLCRRHQLMKVGGMKVYPTEIEEALLAMPEIAEAVVIPVKDPLRGEAPKAFIALKNGADLGQSQIKKRLEAVLHRHKIPRRIEFLDKLPRTAGGKIAWRKLS